MNNIERYISVMKKDWNSPREPVHRGEKLSFKLSCTFSDHGVEIIDIHKLKVDVPEEIKKFWKLSESARLYEDKTYGQWGLEILSPHDAMDETNKQLIERPNDFRDGDLIIGRFIGDSDLLLTRCLREEDYGRILVALPIDPRPDWHWVSKSFGEFLNSYINEDGDKFWE